MCHNPLLNAEKMSLGTRFQNRQCQMMPKAVSDSIFLLVVLFWFCFQFVSVFLCCYKVLAHNSLWGPRLPFISGCRLQVQIIEVNWQDLSLGFQKEFNKKHGFSKMTFAVVRFQGDHDIDHKKKKTLCLWIHFLQSVNFLGAGKTYKLDGSCHLIN